MANEIEVRLILDDGTYKKGILKVEKQAKKSGKKIGNSFEENVGKKLKSSLLSLGPMIAAAAAAYAAAFAGKAAINAAAEAEKSIQGLSTSLQSAGTFSIEMRDSIISLGDEIERTTEVSSEQFQGLVGLAQGYTKTAEAARDLAKASLDFAAGADITVTEAVRRLGRGVQGATGDIANFMPAIRGLTREQLAAGVATKMLADRFAGAAAKESQTFSGSLIKLNAALGSVPEAMGNIIVKSKGLRGIFSFLADDSASTADAIERIGDSGKTFDKLILSTLNMARAMVFILPPIEMMVDAFQAAFRVIQTGFSVMVAAIAMPIAAMAKFFSPESEFTKNATAFADVVANAAVDSATAANESMAEIGKDFSLTDDIDQFIEGMTTRAEAAIYATDTMKEGVNNNFDAMSSNIKKSGEDIRKSMKGTLAGGISKGIQSITTALIKGGNVFEAFASGVLETFGSLAIQLGEFYIAQGIANLALKSVSPLGTIAAGAGLVALGTIMKSFFGGGGGGSEPASTASGGPVAGGGLSSPADDVFTDPEDEVQQGPKIAISIQGNIFDRKETGLEIVSIINEAFEQQGAIVRTA